MIDRINIKIIFYLIAIFNFEQTIQLYFVYSIIALLQAEQNNQGDIYRKN